MKLFQLKQLTESVNDPITNDLVRNKRNNQKIKKINIQCITFSRKGVSNQHLKILMSLRLSLYISH